MHVSRLPTSPALVGRTCLPLYFLSTLILFRNLSDFPLSRDTLNSPFYGYNGDFTQFSANGDSQADRPYAPIPPKYDGGDGVTYKWPFPDAKGYYSHMYTGEIFEV